MLETTRCLWPKSPCLVGFLRLQFFLVKFHEMLTDAKRREWIGMGNGMIIDS